MSDRNDIFKGFKDSIDLLRYSFRKLNYKRINEIGFKEYIIEGFLSIFLTIIGSSYLLLLTVIIILFVAWFGYIVAPALLTLGIISIIFILIASVCILIMFGFRSVIENNKLLFLFSTLLIFLLLYFFFKGLS